MKLSDTSKDFEKIENNDHVLSVIGSIKEYVPNYFKKITEYHLSKEPGDYATPKLIWNRIITEGIENFEKEASSYKSFFSEESMEEFEEMGDPKAFKSELKRDCPIIKNTLFSKQEELQNWKEDFAMAKPQELYETFCNCIDFMHEQREAMADVNYDELVEHHDFLELNKFSEDSDLRLQNVIGAGIKTTVLYNMYPDHFCKSVRRSLYGLYFLTEELHDKMPSRTSEFIIIDDTNNYKRNGRHSTSNLKMDHNYWYPYDLFMLYINHVHIGFEKELSRIGVTLNGLRFLHTYTFMEQICKLKSEAISTMMGTDQDY